MKAQNHQQVTEKLKVIVSSLFFLKSKLQSFHWNVEGPYFQTLHELFGTQYESIEPTVDTLAERIRALGTYAPASIQSMAKASVIKDSELERVAWKDMVKTLRDDHAKLAQICSEGSALAGELQDSVTAGMLDDLTTEHQKAVWMLSATLAE